MKDIKFQNQEIQETQNSMNRINDALAQKCNQFLIKNKNKEIMLKMLRGKYRNT